MVLCDELALFKIKLIGCSGGTLVAINVAPEKPELVECVIADMGRNFAKQNTKFCSMPTAIHGENRESVVDADTEAVVTHVKIIGSFFHKPIEELNIDLLLFMWYNDYLDMYLLGGLL